MRVFSFPALPGTAGTMQAIGIMKTLARRGRVDPLVRDMALKIVQGIPGRSGFDQATAIRRWLAINVEFRRDPTDNELIYSPNRMVRILTERGPPLYIDCDDVATLAAALGGAVGLRARFQVVGFLSPRAPFRHIWADLRDPAGRGPWVQMDVTRQAQSLPLNAAISRRKIIHV